MKAKQTFTLTVGGKSYSARTLDTRTLFCYIAQLGDGRWAVVHIDRVTGRAHAVSRGHNQTGRIQARPRPPGRPSGQSGSLAGSHPIGGVTTPLDWVISILRQNQIKHATHHPNGEFKMTLSPRWAISIRGRAVFSTASLALAREVYLTACLVEMIPPEQVAIVDLTTVIL